MERRDAGRRARRRRARADRGGARSARRRPALIALDTSALAKLVVAEPETPALVAALRDRDVIASELVRTELPRAVLRAAPDRLDAVEALVARLRLVRLDPELLDAAGRLGPSELRSLDAIHLQSALLLGDELAAFVTYDLRQTEAARSLALTVVAPA